MSSSLPCQHPRSSIKRTGGAANRFNRPHSRTLRHPRRTNEVNLKVKQMKNYLIVGALALASTALSMGVYAQTTETMAPMQFVAEQPTNEWLSRVFLGAAVQNTSGETIGDINDLVFSHAGQISTVVLGVGGVLGMGEKNVGIPYTALSFKTGPEGARIIVVALTKAELKQAPSFTAIEKTTYDAMKDKALVMGKKASDKAVELKDQAVQKVEDMKADRSKNQ